MNKQNTMIFVVLGLLLLINHTKSAETTCAAHPGWAKVQKQLKAWAKDEAKSLVNIQALADQFEALVPEAQSEEDLGKCSQYTGELSCCRKQITSFLDRIVHLKVKPQTKSENITKKVLRFTANKLKKNTCVAANGKTKPSAASDIIAVIASLPKTGALLEESKVCKASYNKVVASFARGAACSICAGTDKIDNYYDSKGNIIVKQSSADSFKDAAKVASDCQNNILTTLRVKEAVQEIASYYLAAADACIESISTNASTAFAAKGNADGCTGKNVFSESKDCDKSQEGDDSVEAAAADSAVRLLRQEPMILRNLQDATLDASKGVNIYLVSETDSNLTAEGEINVDDVSVTNNSQKLYFGMFIALISMILLL